MHIHKRSKVVLCVPNFRWVDSDENTLWHYIPYNLCLIAACIRDKHEVSIIDAYKADMSPSELLHVLKHDKPDVVGTTVMMDKYGMAGHVVCEMGKLVGAVTVFGGVYASMNATEVAKDKNVDYVITGEGEYTFGRLVDKLGHKIDYGKIIPGHTIPNLDVLPLPAYDLIDYPAYANTATRASVDGPATLPYARILTSRGCPYGCCFCQVEHIAGKEFRARSAENVLVEMRWLRDKYGIKSWIFDDDNMLYDEQRAAEIFQGMINCRLVMPWKMIATAAFKLNAGIIGLMRESGCVYVDIAIESGCERVLKQVIHKPVDLHQAYKVTRMLQEQGIYVAANFIVGFPTETWDEIRESLAFADILNADYTKIAVAMPLRHTKLWKMCQEHGAFKRGDGVREWSEGQIETKDFLADDLTILRAYEWDRINFNSSEKRSRTCEMMGITEEALLKIRRNTLLKAHQSLSRITTTT
jgi:anaerobic magnesium-protoporphyrin IX monomethyl ester cyclase